MAINSGIERIRLTISMQPALRLFLMGMLLGIAGVLPGALGTIIAVSLGIYEPLIAVLANPLKKVFSCWHWLLPLGLGAIFGWLLFIGVIAKFWLKENSQLYLLTAVLGLVCGLLPPLLKRASARGVGLRHLLTATFGFCLIVAINQFATTPLVQTNLTLSSQQAIFSGSVLGIGGLVPGFSASLLLIGLNLFSLILQALASLSPVLILLVIAYLLVILLGANLMKWLLVHHHASTYYFFFGLAIACLWQIWPSLPLNFTGMILVIIFCFSFVVAYFLNKLSDQLPVVACKQ